MRYKKLRGIGRRINTLLSEIDDLTENITENFRNENWELALCNNYFLDSNKISNRIKGKVIKQLTISFEKIILNNAKKNYCYLLFIFPNELSSSKILVLSNRDEFEDIIKNNLNKLTNYSDEQKQYLVNEFNLRLYNELQISGVKKIYVMDTECKYDELWLFYKNRES